MPTGKPVGTMYVELAMDATKYTAAQKAILAGAEQNSADINKVFSTVGTKSDEMYNAMRKNIENALGAIKQSHLTSADEIVRAEQSAADKIKTINDQQFGAQTSLLDTLKSNWIAAAAVIGTAMVAANKAWDLAKIGAAYEEQKGILDNLSTKYSTTSTAIVSAMETASKGLIADADLMKIALEGVAKGLTPAQLIDLAGAAVILGKAVGKDATTAFNDLAEAMESGRIRSLKGYLGNTLDLTTAFDGLEGKMTSVEKTQAVYAIAMLQATSLQAQQKNEVDSAADKMERLDASYKNITLSIGTFFKTLVVGTIDLPSTINKLMMLTGETANIDAESKSATDSVNKEAEATKNLIAPYQAQIDALKARLLARKDDTEAAKKAAAEQEAAEKSITEAIRKADYEIEGIGQTSYDKDMARIDSETQKYADAGVSHVSLVKFIMSETALAETKQAEIDAKIEADREAGYEEGWKKYGELKLKETAAEKTASDAFDKIVREDNQFAQDENTKAVNAIIAKEGEKVIKLQQDGLIAKKSDEEINAAIVQSHVVADAAILKSNTEHAAKVAKLNSDLVKDIRGYEKEAYDAAIKEIDAKAAKEIADGADYEKVMAQKKDATEKAYIAMGKSGDDFFAGVNAGYLEMQRNAETFGTAGYEIFKTFCDSSKTALSTVLFDSFKTGTFDTQAVWTSFTDTMLKKFTDTIANMAVNAATDAVVMTFKAVTSGNWSDVFGLLNKVWDLGSNLFSGSSNTLGSSDVAYVEHARGGPYSSGQPFWAGEKGPELIFPKSSGLVLTHDQSVAYAARNGGYIPGYQEGGNYSGDTYGAGGTGVYSPEPDPTGRQTLAFYKTIFDAAGFVPWPTLASAAKAYADSPLYVEDLKWARFNPNIAIGQNAGDRPGDVWNKQIAEESVNPYIYGSEQEGDYFVTYWRDGSTTRYLNDDRPSGWAQAFEGVVAAGLIAIAGKVGGPAGAAAGAAAITYIESGGKATLLQEAVAAGMAALATYWAGSGTAGGEAGGGAGEAATYGLGGSGMSGAGAMEAAPWYSAIVDYAEGKATSYAEKWALNKIFNYAMQSIFGGGGSLGISFEGESGDLSGIRNGMNSIAPQSSFFAFSAQNGLDYVPYNNFPISAHQGEAVLNKKDAQDWRGGSTRAGVTVNFNLTGTVIDRVALNEFAVKIHPILYKLNKLGY
jgi:hypothetical protein